MFTLTTYSPVWPELFHLQCDPHTLAALQGEFPFVPFLDMDLDGLGDPGVRNYLVDLGSNAITVQDLLQVLAF